MGENRAGELEDLVGTAQLAVLSLQVLDALGIGGGDAVTFTCIDLVLTYSGMQRLGNTSDLPGDGFDGRPLQSGVLRGAPAPCARGARGLQAKTLQISSWLCSPVMEPPWSRAQF